MTVSRPFAVVVVGWLLIGVGVATILKDVAPLFTSDAARQWAEIRSAWLREIVPAWTLRALAVVGGAGVLRGSNWARWLMAAWLLLHVALAATGPVGNLLLHAVIAAGLIHLMFRRDAALFFGAGRATSR